jgi:hypothetical protein
MGRRIDERLVFGERDEERATVPPRVFVFAAGAHVFSVASERKEVFFSPV